MKSINTSNSDEPPSEFPSLEATISATFIDHDVIIEAVRKHSFEATLYPVLKRANDYIQSGNFDAIPHIVGTLLTTINDKLASVSGKEKSILEELSSELFKEQISVLNKTEAGRNCWQKCLPVLKETCAFKGYCFLTLSQLMGFNFGKKHQTNTTKSNVGLPYYKWLGNDKDLQDLLRCIKDKLWISNIHEFKKIFKPVSDLNYTFKASADHIEKLIVLFSELKNQKLIQPKTNRGHFYPLSRYGVDFDKKVFDKEPKRYLENLKRRKSEYECVRTEIQKIIRINCHSNGDH